MIWNPGDIFFVQKHKTWVGIVITSSLINCESGPVVKLLYRTGDTKFNKRPHCNLDYGDQELPGLTKVKTLKKYQVALLKHALKLSLEKGDINNFEYIEALDKVREVE